MYQSPPPIHSVTRASWKVTVILVGDRFPLILSIFNSEQLFNLPDFPDTFLQLCEY